jgi:hypothetical protein
VIEQLLGLPGILAGDAVRAPQHIERSQGDVLKIADGGGDQVESGQQVVAVFVRRGVLGSGVLAGFLALHAALL